MNMKKEICAVVVCGMTQSGSTLLYNIIREFFEYNDFNVLGMLGSQKAYVTEGFKDARKNNNMVQLTKQHDASQSTEMWEKVIFVNTRRDLRDCIASVIRKNPSHMGGDLIKIGDQNLQYFECSKSFIDYQWNYEEYKNNPIVEIEKLFRFLSKFTYESIIQNFNHKNKKINPDNIYESDVAKIIHTCENIKKLKIPASAEGYAACVEEIHLYNKTFMSKKHITSNDGKIGGYKLTLTKEQINLIEEKYKPWLVQNGYMK